MSRRHAGRGARNLRYVTNTSDTANKELTCTVCGRWTGPGAEPTRPVVCLSCRGAAAAVQRRELAGAPGIGDTIRYRAKVMDGIKFGDDGRAVMREIVRVGVVVAVRADHIVVQHDGIELVAVQLGDVVTMTPSRVQATTSAAHIAAAARTWAAHLTAAELRAFDVAATALHEIADGRR